MSVINLVELLAPRSAQQVINDTLAFLASPPDPSLVTVRTANWRTGGPYRTLIYRQGIEASLLYQVVAGLAGSSFLRYARGKWLDWLGEDYFNEPRQDAQFATVNVRFTVPLGAGPLGPIPLRVATPDGQEFVSVAAETIPAGPAVVTFTFKAAKAGAVYNVAAGQINQLVSPNVLGITVTNLAAATGGYDREPDDRYAQRLAAKWGTLSPGSTAAAYVYWALTASKEVTKVRVYSDLYLGAFTPNWVTVYLASDAGIASAQAIADVLAYITPRVPLDIKVDVQSVVPFAVSVTGLVKVFTPYVGEAPAAIANSLQALNKRVPIGSYDQGPIPVAEVNDAVFWDATKVYDVALTNPTAPISLNKEHLLQLTNNTTVVGV